MKITTKIRHSEQKVTRKRSDIDITQARPTDLDPITVDPVRGNDPNRRERKRDRGREVRDTVTTVIGEHRDDLEVEIDIESGRIGPHSLHALEGNAVITVVRANHQISVPFQRKPKKNGLSS